MIDKNKDCVTKSKLTTTVKTFSKYNDRSRLAAKQTNKQTNRLRDTEASKNLGRKQKNILTNRYKQTCIGYTHTQR